MRLCLFNCLALVTVNLGRPDCNALLLGSTGSLLVSETADFASLDDGLSLSLGQTSTSRLGVDGFLAFKRTEHPEQTF